MYYIYYMLHARLYFWLALASVHARDSVRAALLLPAGGLRVHAAAVEVVAAQRNICIYVFRTWLRCSATQRSVVNARRRRRRRPCKRVAAINRVHTCVLLLLLLLMMLLLLCTRAHFTTYILCLSKRTQSAMDGKCEHTLRF